MWEWEWGSGGKGPERKEFKASGRALMLHIAVVGLACNKREQYPWKVTVEHEALAPCRNCWEVLESWLISFPDGPSVQNLFLHDMRFDSTLFVIRHAGVAARLAPST